MSPASPRDRPHRAMTVGMTKLYICTSNASSAQPPKQAPIVRRSCAFSSPNQPSIARLLYNRCRGKGDLPIERQILPPSQFVTESWIDVARQCEVVQGRSDDTIVKYIVAQFVDRMAATCPRR